MFKLFHIRKDGIEDEIKPHNDIYIVYELYEYRFEYFADIQSSLVFIGDEALDESMIISSSESIRLTAKKRIFEDYFGYLIITINNIKVNIEVRVRKLEVRELEEILVYLWNQDPIIFDNFFSKSSLKAKLDRENDRLDYSSKFLNIFEDYYKFFKEKCLVFSSLPHTVLRTVISIRDYESADISSGSVDWLVNNLDELHIDYLYKNVTNAIQINNNYALVEKILTEENVNDYNTYENQIILGSFEFIIREISNLKAKIQKSFVETEEFDKDFQSINNLKILPFLKLREDLYKIEGKIKSLHRKYQEIFVKAKSKNSFPKLTPVFSNKRHYRDAYNKIKLIRDIRISLEGEINLINIKRVSTLYERFNLYVLINALLSKKPISFVKEGVKEGENIFQEYYFQYPHLKVSLFYDFKVDNQDNKTGLQRISKDYYRPDYILKVESGNATQIYILDSKYSFKSTVENNHLASCINKYILDMGSKVSSTQKAEELVLIYPGEIEKTVFGSDIFKPKISILPSKANKNNLQNFVERLFL